MLNTNRPSGVSKKQTGVRCFLLHAQAWRLKAQFSHSRSNSKAPQVNAGDALATAVLGAGASSSRPSLPSVPSSWPENLISPSASHSSVRSGMFIVTRPYKNLLKLR